LPACLPDAYSRHSACALDDRRTVVILTHKGTLVFDGEGFVAPQTSGCAPEGLSMCTCAAVGRDVLVFGGATRRQEMSADVFALDTTTWRWRKLRSVGTPPSPRASACGCACADGATLAVYGGGGIRTEYAGGKGLRAFDDLYTLKVRGDVAEWRRVAEACTGQPRVAASLDLVDDVPVLHGGWDPASTATFETTHTLALA